MSILSARALLGLVSFVVFSSGTILEYHQHDQQTPLGTCSTENPILSCHNTSPITDTCCSPTPGGLVLQTQFWDTYTGLESSGQYLPKGNWTVHGLWPDRCDGGDGDYYCDFSRQYDEKPSPKKVNGKTVPKYFGPTVDAFITAAGRDDLLAFMNKYWVSQRSENAGFWAHEYSKHATCFSTFDTECYPSFKKHDDLIDFFETTTKAWLKFPTYDWLAAANIFPSNTTTYDLSAIQDALKLHTGALPRLGCVGDVLNEVWYYNNVRGPVQGLDFQAVEATKDSDCPSTGIWYPERTPGSEE